MTRMQHIDLCRGGLTCICIARSASNPVCMFVITIVAGNVFESNTTNPSIFNANIDRPAHRANVDDTAFERSSLHARHDRNPRISRNDQR